MQIWSGSHGITVDRKGNSGHTLNVQNVLLPAYLRTDIEGESGVYWKTSYKDRTVESIHNKKIMLSFISRMKRKKFLSCVSYL